MGEPAASESRRYEFDYTPHFVDQLCAAPHFYGPLLRLLQGLERYPFPGTAVLGVRDYKEEDLLNAYTVPIKAADGDESLLVFQVMTRVDVIKLVQFVVIGWTHSDGPQEPND